MENELKFPTFECVISNTQEDYDSEVEYFFLVRQRVALKLASLRIADREWKDNYEKLIHYLRDLADAIVDKKDPPSHDFLVSLSMGDELEDDSTERMLRTENPAVPAIMEVATLVRELMYWYVRNSKVERFSESFNPERFQGLSFMRLALVYRSVKLSRS